jgi:polar amino acid transport system substrate-binding protein
VVIPVQAAHPTPEAMETFMREPVMGRQDAARRRATRAGRFVRLLGGVLGGVLALAAAGCQRTDTPITTLDDAATARIGVMGGSVGEQIVLERFPQADIKTFDDIMDAVSAIRAGQLDAVVTAFPGALQVTKTNPDLTLVAEPLSAENTAVAARQSDTVLLAAVNDALDSLRRDGTLTAMKTRWFKSDLSPYNEPDIPNSPTGEPLTIGVSATREPFSFVDGSGRITGHDGELARRLGALLHRPVVFSNMKLMALIPALQSGKIDLVVTGIADTPERRKRVAFSTTYYENAQRMMVNKPGGATGALGVNANHEVAPSWFEGIGASIQSNLIQEQRYLLLLDGLRTTVLIALLSAFFGTLLGALVCALRMSENRLLSRVAMGYIAVLRGTPVVVLLMLVFYVVFASVNINPVVVAVLAFGMNFAAYVAELFRTGIEGIDRGQTEAGLSMGFTKVATFTHIVLPQMVQRVLPVYKGEFISLVKMTSIVGYIAVQDLTKASDIIRSRTFDAFFPLVLVAILYFLIAWVLTRALDALERRTDPRQRRQARSTA